MNKEEVKLSDKELHKAIDNLKGTQFLDAFCILDWIIKTRDENEQLQQKVNQLETNRDELKKWLKVCLEENNKIRLYDNNSYQAGEINTLENVIDKMEELERGKE